MKVEDVTLADYFAKFAVAATVPRPEHVRVYETWVYVYFMFQYLLIY